jgi:hypothetical protein
LSVRMRHGHRMTGSDSVCPRPVFVGQALLPVHEVPARERWNNKIEVVASAIAAAS